LTPTSGPPAYRIYDVDPKTFGVLDFTVYIANISDPAYPVRTNVAKILLGQGDI
jgi:sphingomyelin phosphodiesterase